VSVTGKIDVILCDVMKRLVHFGGFGSWGLFEFFVFRLDLTGKITIEDFSDPGIIDEIWRLGGTGLCHGNGNGEGG